MGPGGAIIYLTILLLALWRPRRGEVFMLAAFVFGLIMIDAWLHPFADSIAAATSERLSVIASTLVASLLIYASPHHGGRRQADEAADKTDAEARVNMKMAALAHEVRSPLNAIVGFAQIIESEMYGPLGDKRYLECARDIQASGRHILSVSDDYLGLARLASDRETLNLSRVGVRRLIESVGAMIEPLALNSYVVIEIDTPSDLPDVRADASKIAQILLNLLVNAVKFSDGGGRVNISARIDFEGDMILMVADNGDGMTEADIRAAMTPFADTEAPGRARNGGLGLSLVKSLVEQHGGDFWLESVSGGGAKAFVRLPAARLLKPKSAAPGDCSCDAQADLFNNPST
jgi:signal transduction histidine kinase